MSEKKTAAEWIRAWLDDPGLAESELEDLLDAYADSRLEEAAGYLEGLAEADAAEAVRSFKSVKP